MTGGGSDLDPELLLTSNCHQVKSFGDSEKDRIFAEKCHEKFPLPTNRVHIIEEMLLGLPYALNIKNMQDYGEYLSPPSELPREPYTEKEWTEPLTFLPDKVDIVIYSDADGDLKIVTTMQAPHTRRKFLKRLMEVLYVPIKDSENSKNIRYVKGGVKQAKNNLLKSYMVDEDEVANWPIHELWRGHIYVDGIYLFKDRNEIMFATGS